MTDTLEQPVGVGSPSRIPLHRDDRVPEYPSVWVSFPTSHTATIAGPTFGTLSEDEIVNTERREAGSSLLDYVSARLDRYLNLTGELRVEPVAKDEIIDAMQEIGAAGDFVFPNVAPNGEGGVVLFWKAEARSIEVDLDPGGEYYLQVTDSSGARILEEEGSGPLPVEQLTAAIAAFTSDVEATNPHWRRLFAA